MKRYQIVEHTGYEMSILNEFTNPHDAWNNALCLAKLSPAEFNIQYSVACLLNDTDQSDFYMQQSTNSSQICTVLPKEGIIIMPDNILDDYEHYLLVQCVTDCDCRPFDR